MAKSRLAAANQEIARKVTGGYKAIESGTVGGYRKIENWFVDQFLTKEGETVEMAKERLAAEQAERGNR